MVVSYKKIWKILVEREMRKVDLRKNEYVAMPILDKICITLGTDYGESMEYVTDRNEQEQIE